MLEFDIRKTYRSKKREVEVKCKGSCKAGEVTAIYGKSGVGKSTVLRMIAGLDKPDAGFISYSGKKWFSKELSTPVREREVCLVFQEDNLFENMTVQQNLAYAALNGIPDRIKNLVSNLGLNDLLEARPHELSGGQKQKIALLRALCTEADVILLDEPFSALDDESIDELIDIIQALKDGLERTIILVTHRMEIVNRLTQSVIRMG